MNQRNIWNITITTKKNEIHLNASLFFFFFLPIFYYLKESSSVALHTMLPYIIIFLIFVLPKSIFLCFAEKNIKVYPFGVLNLSRNNEQDIAKKDVFYFIFESIFLILSFIFLYKLQLEKNIYYPVTIFLCNLLYFLNRLKKISVKASFYIVAVFLLFSSFFNSSIEFVIFFLSFINSSFFNKEFAIIDIFEKEFFVKEMMTKKDDLMILSPTDSVENIVEEVIKRPQNIFPVVVKDRFIGIARKDDIILAFKASIVGDYPFVDEITKNIDTSVSPDSSVQKAKEAFETSSKHLKCIPVIEDGKFLGLLIYEFFVEYISIKKILFKIKMVK